MASDRGVRVIGAFTAPVAGRYTIRFRVDERTSSYEAVLVDELKSAAPDVNVITTPLEGTVELALGPGRWRLLLDPMRGLVIERTDVDPPSNMRGMPS